MLFFGASELPREEKKLNLGVGEQNFLLNRNCAWARPVASHDSPIHAATSTATAGSSVQNREEFQHQYHPVPDEHPNSRHPLQQLALWPTRHLLNPNEVPGNELVTATLRHNLCPQEAHNLRRDSYNKANSSLTMIVAMRAIIQRIIGTERMGLLSLLGVGWWGSGKASQRW